VNHEESSSGNYNKLLRLVRLPRLYRMLRILRLLKMMKMTRQNNRGLARFWAKIKMDNNIVRMFKGIATSILLTHIFACFWYLIAKFEDFDPDTWVIRMGLEGESTST